jgi:hypothetical protein
MWFGLGRCLRRGCLSSARPPRASNATASLRSWWRVLNAAGCSRHPRSVCRRRPIASSEDSIRVVCGYGMSGVECRKSRLYRRQHTSSAFDPGAEVAAAGGLPVKRTCDSRQLARRVVPRGRQDSRADRRGFELPAAADRPAYSTVTINLLKPRRTLFSARSSASIWKRLTFRASAVKRARISNWARFMPRHMCGPAPNAM